MPISKDIQPSESLSSFFARLLLIQGAPLTGKNINGIMRQKPLRWSSVRQIPFDLKSYFDGWSHEEKTHLLWRTSTILEAQFFEDPVHFHKLVLKMFRETNLPDITTPRKMKGRVTFCQDCFDAQITTNGFIWYKVEWQNSHRCEIHKRPLKYASCPNCSHRSLKEELTAAFSGVCRACGNHIWETASDLGPRELPPNKKQPHINSDDDLSTSETPRNLLLEYSPCYMEFIGNVFMHGLADLLLKDTPRNSVEGDLAPLVQTLASIEANKLQKLKICHELCRFVEHSNDPALKQWVNDHSVLRHYFLSDEKPNECHFKYRVLKHRRCQVCKPYQGVCSYKITQVDNGILRVC